MLHAITFFSEFYLINFFLPNRKKFFFIFLYDSIHKLVKWANIVSFSKNFHIFISFTYFFQGRFYTFVFERMQKKFNKGMWLKNEMKLTFYPSLVKKNIKFSFFIYFYMIACGEFWSHASYFFKWKKIFFNKEFS